MYENLIGNLSNMILQCDPVSLSELSSSLLPMMVECQPGCVLVCWVCRVDTKGDEVLCSRRIVPWYGTSKIKKKKKKKRDIQLVLGIEVTVVQCCNSVLV